ncbi:MAG: hypothetical protein ACLTDI_13610 [Acutalibacteraceae bacterium]
MTTKIADAIISRWKLKAAKAEPFISGSAFSCRQCNKAKYKETEVGRVSEEYAIELKNITKRFGKVTANDKVCLFCRRGKSCPSWVRTEAERPPSMNMISGIYYPDEGQIFVNGKEVTIRSP